MANKKRRTKKVICLKCDKEFKSPVTKSGKRFVPQFKTCPNCRESNSKMDDFGGSM